MPIKQKACFLYIVDGQRRLSGDLVVTKSPLLQDRPETIFVKPQKFKKSILAKRREIEAK
jgi:hypothetical protein